MNPSNSWQPTPIGVPQAEAIAYATPPQNNNMDESKETALDTEWVIRAKEIATQLSADPYEQSRQLSTLKAQFIKARYNRDVRTVED